MNPNGYTGLLVLRKILHNLEVIDVNINRSHFFDLSRRLEKKQALKDLVAYEEKIVRVRVDQEKASRFKKRQVHKE